MITMLMTIEDVSKVDDVKKFAHDNNIKINWEKNKINRNKSNFFTKIKNRIVKTFEQFTQKT
jgi:ABC-type bacteriocin/lantibiotic exporter with double-glycine peptidase domain